MAEVIRIRALDIQLTERDEHLHMDDFRVLSIGTGFSEFSLSPPGPDAGLLFWAPNVTDVMGQRLTATHHLIIAQWAVLGAIENAALTASQFFRRFVN